MTASVVDTNVLVVANGLAEQASLDCQLACVDALERITKHGLCVLDEEGRILDEYARNASRSGQPGTGDAFLKWATQNQANRRCCERVPITPRCDDPDDFEEFPRDERLHEFDRSDRKFVAVALASKNDPQVLNAVDSDWWIHRKPLQDSGVQIRFLCPDQFT